MWSRAQCPVAKLTDDAFSNYILMWSRAQCPVAKLTDDAWYNYMLLTIHAHVAVNEVHNEIISVITNTQPTFHLYYANIICFQRQLPLLMQKTKSSISFRQSEQKLHSSILNITYWIIVNIVNSSSVNRSQINILPSSKLISFFLTNSF